MLVTDGAGGTFVFWREGGGNFDLVPKGTRLNASGQVATGWPGAGLSLPPENWNRVVNFDAVPDDNGGVYVVHDWPSDELPLTLVRLNGDGTTGAGWPVTAGRYTGSAPGRDGDNQILKAPQEALPWLAVDPGHGPIVAWWSVHSRGSVLTMAAGFDPAGALIPGWSDNLIVKDWASHPVIGPDGSGGAFVAWYQGGPQQTVIAKHFIASGDLDDSWAPENAGGLQLCPYADGVQAIQMVTDGSNGALVAWQQVAEGRDELRIQKLTIGGSYGDGWPAEGIVVAQGAISPAIWRDARMIRWTPFTAMVSDHNGGAYLSWIDRRNDPDGDLYVQHILGDGTVAAGWPEGGALIASGPGLQGTPSLAIDDNGGALIAWEDRGADPAGDVLVQKLAFDGVVAPTWPAGGIAVDREGGQTSPAVVHDGRGGAIVVWSGERDSVTNLYARRLVVDRSTAVLASLVEANAFTDRVRIQWQLGGTPASEVVVERNDGTWRDAAVLIADGIGRVTFEDRNLTPGERYGYRLRSQGEPPIGETWVDVPWGATFALAGAAPNPAAGAVHVRLSLPDRSPARLDLVDVSGRSILSREVGELGPGAHTVPIDLGASAPAGIYWLRLTRGAEQRSTKVVLAR